MIIPDDSLHEFTGTTRFGMARGMIHHARWSRHLLEFLDLPSLPLLKRYDLSYFGITVNKAGCTFTSMSALVFPLSGQGFPEGETLVLINQLNPAWHLWHVFLFNHGDLQTQGQPSIRTIVREHLVPYALGKLPYTIGSWLLITEQKVAEFEWSIAVAECAITYINQPHKHRFFNLAAAIVSKQTP